MLTKAMELHRQGKIDEAEKKYEEFMEDHPDDPTVLNLMGTVWFQRKRYAIAGQFFRRAVYVHPTYFDGLNNLGNCCMMATDLAGAKKYWEAALKVQGHAPFEYADIQNNVGILYINAGTPGLAKPYLDEALKLNPDHPDAQWNVALMNLEMGNYAEGFDKYKAGFKTKHRLLRGYGEKIKPYEGEKGKNVVVWGEQGIGDEIMFASIIPDLMKISKSVVFDCHPRLVKIFHESFGIPCYGTRKEQMIYWPGKHPDLDSCCAVGDLGRFFRRKLEDFPKENVYLKASEDRVKHYRNRLARLGDRLKVGISWTGGYKKTRKDYRTIPLTAWKPIFEKCDCDFISLQYTDDAYASAAVIEDDIGVRIHHWPSAVQNEDYHETAALVTALDLVITVNTAVHHLSGGLGKECWTLTPFAKAWRYYSPDDHTIPWYPSCYQYQQKQLFDWNGIIGQVSRRLRDKIRLHNESKNLQMELVSL